MSHKKPLGGTHKQTADNARYGQEARRIQNAVVRKKSPACGCIHTYNTHKQSRCVDHGFQGAGWPTAAPLGEPRWSCLWVPPGAGCGMPTAVLARSQTVHNRRGNKRVTQGDMRTMPRALLRQIDLPLLPVGLMAVENGHVTNRTHEFASRTAHQFLDDRLLLVLELVEPHLDQLMVVQRLRGGADEGMGSPLAFRRESGVPGDAQGGANAFVADW